MNPSPAVPGAAPAGAAAAAAAGTPGKPSGWAAGKTVRWSKPPIGDTSCCCRPLTGAPYLRPGPHAGHGCSEAFGQGRHRTFRPSIQLGVASSLFSAHLHSLSMDESLSVSLLFVVAFARVLPALLNPAGLPLTARAAPGRRRRRARGRGGDCGPQLGGALGQRPGPPAQGDLGRRASRRRKGRTGGGVRG